MKLVKAKTLEQVVEGETYGYAPGDQRRSSRRQRRQTRQLPRAEKRQERQERRLEKREARRERAAERRQARRGERANGQPGRRDERVERRGDRLERRAISQTPVNERRASRTQSAAQRVETRSDAAPDGGRERPMARATGPMAALRPGGGRPGRPGSGPMPRGPLARRFMQPQAPEGEEPEIVEEEQEDEGEQSWPEEDGSADLMGRWNGPLPRQFGPPTPLGTNLRLQTSPGFQAGVIELRPGLFLVAEVPTQVARSEFGIAVLAPLVTSVALKALENPETQKQLARTAERGVALVTRQMHRRDTSPVPWADEEELAGVVAGNGSNCACCHGRLP